PSHSLRHWLALWLFAMNAARLADLLQIRLIGRRTISGVGPHIRGRVVRIDQPFAQSGAVMSCRIAGFLPPDDAMLPIDRDVAFVAEDGNGEVDLRLAAVLLWLGLRELHRPARVAILLTQPGRLVLPFFRYLSRLDGGLLGFGVPLLRRRHQGGVN